MSLDAELRRFLLETAMEALTEAAAKVAEQAGRPRMLPIKEAPIAYRLLLDAEKAGQIRVYRVGHASFVDESELFAYIRRTGRKPDAIGPEPVDEIGALIQRGDKSRGRKATK